MLRSAIQRHFPRPLARYLLTISYLKPEQVSYRLIHQCKTTHFLFRGTNAHSALQERAEQIHLLPQKKRMPRWRIVASVYTLKNKASEATRLRGGEFTFLNQKVRLGFPPTWKIPRGSDNLNDPALWYFHLHYLEWIWFLMADGKALDALTVIQSWIDENQLGQRDGFRGPWSSYTVSRRLPVMMTVYAMLLSQHIEDTDEKLFRSMKAHLLFLSENLEKHHGANHLLENLITLAMGTTFFEGTWAERNRNAWLTLLYRQLDEQFSQDGFHFERCPSYHNDLINRLLDLWFLMGGEATEKLTTIISKGLRVSELMTTPGGYPVPLGDGNLSSLDCSTLTKKARRYGFPTTQRSIANVYTVIDHHVIHRDSEKKFYLLIDGANLGPDHSGAHQHADLMGMEFWIDGVPVIADGGCGRYAPGNDRLECRAAEEHLSLTIDGNGPADPWKSFRMGWRGHMTRFVEQSRGETHYIHMEHDGFRYLGWRHQRKIQWNAGEGYLLIRDRLLPQFHFLCKRSPTVLHIPFGDEVKISSRNLRSPRVKLQTPEGRSLSLRWSCSEDTLVKLGKGKRWKDFGSWATRSILSFHSNVPPTGLSFSYLLRF